MSPTPTDPNQAQAWITGDPPDQTIDFYIPRGNTGPMGPQGPMGPSVAVGTIETNTGPVAQGLTGPTGPGGQKGDPGGIVDGTSLGAQDLNTIVTSGVYRQMTSNGSNSQLAQNYPYAGGYGVLHVYVTNGTDIVQIFYPQSYATGIDAKRFYMRNRSNNAWSPWRMFGAIRTDQTAGRTMYAWDDVNNREQLIYGDTGIRAVTAENSFVGTVNLRRVGGIVTAAGTLQRPPGGSINGKFLTVPTGFQPSSTAWIYTAVRNNASSASFWLYRQNTDLLFSDAVPANDSDGAQVRFEVSWSCTASWPTVLPGSAVGSVNNT